LRSALRAALVARAEKSVRSKVRRFVNGLSCDELQFIASFLGACILESARSSTRSERISERWPAQMPEDRELKMILLVEYLSKSGIQNMPIALRSEARLG
jgi:hypothetical protein